MYNFALMGNPKDLKLFFVYALEEIFSKINYDENIFYIIGKDGIEKKHDIYDSIVNAWDFKI